MPDQPTQQQLRQATPYSQAQTQAQLATAQQNIDSFQPNANVPSSANFQKYQDFQRGFNKGLKSNTYALGLGGEELRGFQAGKQALADYKLRSQAIAQVRAYAKQYGVPVNERNIDETIKEINSKISQQNQNIQTQPAQPIKQDLSMQSQISKAPSTFEQYRSYLQNKNPVSGTLSYAFEKARGVISKNEQSALYGQSIAQGETGERAAQLAQTGVYFTPIGAPLLAATGIGQFTPGGQRETQATAQALKQSYGIPEPISKTGIYSLSALGAAVGGAQTIKELGTMAGYPKYSTTFLSRAQNFGQSDGTLIGQTAAITKETNVPPFANRYFASGSQTIMKTAEAAKPEDVLFKGATIGVMREAKGVSLSFPSGYKQILGQPQPFAEAFIGTAKPATGNILGAGEAYNAFALSKSQLAGKSPSFFLDATAALRKDSQVFSAGRYYPIASKSESIYFPKSGRGSVVGITSYAPEAEQGTGELIVGSGKSSQAMKPFSSAQAVEAAQTRAAIERAAREMPKSSQAETLKTLSQGIIGAQATQASQLLQPVKENVFIGTTQATPTLESQRLPFIQSPQNLLKQQTQERVVPVQASPLVVKTSQNARFALFQSQAMQQEQQQQQRQVMQYPFIPPSAKTGKKTFLIPPRLRGSLGYAGFQKNKKSENVFVAEVRRRGKFIPVSGRTSLEKAALAGYGITRNTLGASYEVVNYLTGKPVKLKLPSPSYRYGIKRGAINPYIAVQKRGTRLSSPGEIGEIKASRSKSLFFKPRKK